MGMIIQTKDPEKAWNAFRFGEKALKDGHEVRTFLLGEGVECEEITHEKFKVREQMLAFLDAGGQILACGSCLKLRQKNPDELCPLSTMQDLVNLVVWSDRVVTF
ncbi:MAG: DsrE family protein [Firmicutes bacterium]|nr:DsrE family protein [Bacillota bacterium]